MKATRTVAKSACCLRMSVLWQRVVRLASFSLVFRTFRWYASGGCGSGRKWFKASQWALSLLQDEDTSLGAAIITGMLVSSVQLCSRRVEGDRNPFLFFSAPYQRMKKAKSLSPPVQHARISPFTQTVNSRSWSTFFSEDTLGEQLEPLLPQTCLHLLWTEPQTSTDRHEFHAYMLSQSQWRLTLGLATGVGDC